MKNVSTKIAYMVIGSILTLIGYHFGNIENNTVDAQEDNPITEEIRSRRFVLVGQNDNIPRVVIETTRDGHGSIAIGNQNGMLRLRLKSLIQDNGMETGEVTIYQEEGELIALIGSDQNGGSMSIYNGDRVRDGVITNTLEPVVQIATTTKGHGFVLTKDVDELQTGTLGPRGSYNATIPSRDMGVINKRVDRVDTQMALTVNDMKQLELRGDLPSAQNFRILQKGDEIPPFKEEDCKLLMFITWNRSTIGEVEKNEIEFRPDGESQIILTDGTRYTSSKGCTIRDFTIISGALLVYVPGQIPPVSK